jgi:phosphinothricin acetyltransferase
MKVRIATGADARGILEIYAPHIEKTACTFETVVPSIDQFAERIEKGLEKFPWIVLEHDGVTGAYVYASTHREREAYQWTCECSVYVRDNFQGAGVGFILYEALYAILKMQGIVNLYAGITLPNEASIRLHEKCGFEQFATYNNIGFKLGRWHNVGWWKRQLNEYSTTPPPPVKFSRLEYSKYSGYLEKAKKDIRLTG